MCLCSVVPDPLRPHRLQPTRLLCPWDFSSKNTGVDCLFLFQGHLPDPAIKPVSPASPALAGGFLITEPPGKPFKVSGGGDLVAKSCPTLATPCQAPLSMGFFRQEYWSGLPFPTPGDHPGPKDRTWVSCIAGRFFAN